MVLVLFYSKKDNLLSMHHLLCLIQRRNGHKSKSTHLEEKSLCKISQAIRKYFKETIKQATKHLQDIILKLLRYDFDFQYVKGTNS